MSEISEETSLMLNTLALARSAMAARFGQQYDGARDTQKILGYKKTLLFDDFLAMYERQDVAGRIVDMPAQETWRKPPRLVPKKREATKEDDPFTSSMEELNERVSLWHFFEKVDRLCGIGRYGVLFIGVAGSGNLRSEVTEVESLDDIIYLQAYHQGKVEVKKWVTDTNDPRFGYPLIYEIELANFVSESTTGTLRKSEPGTTVKEEVHWSRVIHVADDAIYDNVHGRPRLQRVFDRMFDLVKIAGGSSEMFWQNVAQLWHANLDPELQYDEDDLKKLDEKFQEMLLGIRRLIQTEGVDIKSLSGGTPDPRGVFEVLKSLISSASEIPQRILFGSEQGELASTQDQSEWYGRIQSRRTRFADPWIIRPFVQRLASWGALTVPAGGYSTEWPSLFQESPMDQANRARGMALAAAKYDQTHPDRLFTVEEIREAAGQPREHPDPALVQKIQQEKEDAKIQAEEARKAALEQDDEEQEEAPTSPPQPVAAD